MNDKLESLIYGVANAFISYLIIFVIGMISISNGTVLISDAVYLSNNTYISKVNIVNSSDEVLRNLELLIPGKILDIKSDGAIDIKEHDAVNTSTNDVIVANTGERIYISSIGERSNQQIYITYSTEVDTTIRVYNLKENDLELKNYDDYLNPKTEIFRFAAVVAIVYGIISTIASYITIRRNEKNSKDAIKKYEEVEKELNKAINHNKKIADDTQKHIDQLIKEQELSEKRSDELRNETKDIRKLMTKNKLLYISRITDMKKELDFWRDTVRKILYMQNPETLIEGITLNLKTYSTLKKETDINYDFLTLLNEIEDLKEK